MHRCLTSADFQTGALKAIDLEAIEKVNVGLETELVKNTSPTFNNLLPIY